MKPIYFSLLAAAALLPAGASAQSYSINRFTIAGATAQSQGGQFSIEGTIGQPEAGETLVGGAYSLTGGFWALTAEGPAPEGPRISITATGADQATISWSPAPPGFLLQMSDGLSPATWVDVPGGFTTPIVVTPGKQSKFFRLVRVESF